MRCVYQGCTNRRAREDMCLIHMPRDTHAAWRSAADRSRVVSVLKAAGYRPEPMRSLPNHAAWGAPDIFTAACPLCSPGEQTLRLESWDGGTIVWCSADGVCPSRNGATTERAVHDYLWGALIMRLPDLWDLDVAGSLKSDAGNRQTRPAVTVQRSPLRGYDWRRR
jgi:hypothetical protein